MADIVYIGIWNAYGRDSVFNKVLTVPYRTGTILVTLLAILVTFTANRSWKIWRFLLHELLNAFSSRLRPQKAFPIRQQQAILRNSETTGGALLSFTELAWARKKTTKPVSSTKFIAAALILFALLHWIGFLALGILTTQINIGSIVRSINTPSCGTWLPFESLSSDLYSATGAELLANTSIAAENYVRNCYVSQGASISDCNLFVQRSIPHFTKNVECPFYDSSLCSGSTQEALLMETGNISFSDLGINWKLARGVAVRRRAICTPLDTEPFLCSDEASRNYTEDSIHGDVNKPEQLRGYAFTVDEIGRNVTQLYRQGDAGEYDLMLVSAADGTFAIDALRPRDLSAELTVITLRGRSILFPAPSSDPFFYAQTKPTIQLENSTSSFYTMSRAINSIACLDSAMICSNITGYCSDWLGPEYMALYASQVLGPFRNNTEALAAYGMATLPLMLSTTYYGLNNRGGSVLQASRHVMSGVQYLLSDGQWKLELENWFRIGLAILQMSPYRTISTPELDKSRVQNLMSEARAATACSAVQFRSSKHVTLSVFGILLVVILSLCFTALSYMDSILSLLLPQQASSILLGWEENGYLHLLEKSKKTDADPEVLERLQIADWQNSDAAGANKPG
ncbi:hypothetical protein BDV95DRAFT_601146 [Massariosphaeria phaeospora]|uniref:Uncharacterized protein n=1 Tax=Massariosphaeria phaeospora TaxID=100035 RepID=A0A7C8IIK0_9PLEO|nr:hypothetical protein BDV95DRAFT_601146 [Massariosphaeria phaeospora]